MAKTKMDPEKRKDCTLQIRITHIEYLELKKHCEENKIKKSKFIHECVFNHIKQI